MLGSGMTNELRPRRFARTTTVARTALPMHWVSGRMRFCGGENDRSNAVKLMRWRQAGRASFISLVTLFRFPYFPQTENCENDYHDDNYDSNCY